MSNTSLAQWPGWETGKLLGRGSFGAVYEIRRDVLGDVEKAALKVISIPQNDSDIDEMYNDGYDEASITSAFQSHLKSIVSEYSLMRKMNGSANVVNCDDIRYVQRDNGIGWDIFIKMELLTPLGKALPTEIPEEMVIKIARDLCAALELCKKYEIVHRDIKPQNIFVSPNGDYKLGDFGIAKTVEKTTGGTKIGTYKYMAPEVYNNQPYGHSADIYSLGLVLYWMLNKRRMPFLPLPPAQLGVGMEEQARMRRFMGEALPAPVHGSDELKRIVLKACAYDSKARYHTAKEMLEDLEKLGVVKAAPVAVVPVVTPNVENPKPAAEQTWDEDATVGMGFERHQENANADAAENLMVTSHSEPAVEPNLDEDATFRMDVQPIAAASHHESAGVDEEKESEIAVADDTDTPVSPVITTEAKSELSGVVESAEKTQPASKRKKNKKTLLIIAAILVSLLVALTFIPVYGEWSEWSPVEPEAGNKKIEAMDQYSYRSKELVELEQGTTPPSSAELIDQREDWSAYSAWSDWLEYSADNPEVSIDPNTMTVYAENYQADNETEGDPSYATDGDPSTFWHTVWSDSARDTHYLIFTFNELTAINGMRFLQRSGYVNGVVTKYDLYVRESTTEEWTLIVDDGVLETDSTWQKVAFDPVNALQVKFQVVDAKSDSSKKYAAAAEIRFTVEAGENCEIESRTQYRSRTVSVEEAYSEWSDWSEWSRVAYQEPSNLVEMESRTAYYYDVYRYYCLICGKSSGHFGLTTMSHARDHGIPEEKIDIVQSALVGNCSKEEGLAAASWAYAREVLYTGTLLTIESGTINYDGTIWYAIYTDPEAFPQYRYRTRTLGQQTVYSEWSEFSDTPITETANTEVETREQYRYRTRKMTIICRYDVWGEWSEWQTTPVQQDANTEVKQGTFYRYAEKYFLWQKLFGLMP